MMAFALESQRVPLAPLSALLDTIVLGTILILMEWSLVQTAISARLVRRAALSLSPLALPGRCLCRLQRFLTMVAAVVKVVVVEVSARAVVTLIIAVVGRVEESERSVHFERSRRTRQANHGL